MKPQNAARVERTRQELLKGYTRKRVIDNLSREFEMSPNSIGYFITMAYKEMEKEAKEKKELLARIRNEQVEQLASNLVASKAEAEAYLTQILRGEKLEEKIVYTENGPEVIKVAPKISDMLKAIDIYFLRDGSSWQAKNPPALEPLGMYFSNFPLKTNAAMDGEEEKQENPETTQTNLKKLTA